MDESGSEAEAGGTRLRCGRCGTSLRLEQIGGGRMECCEHPLRPAGDARVQAAADLGAVRCSGCGNQARLERDGGGTLRCCNKPMEALG